MNVPEAVRWHRGRLSLLDQRALPHEVRYLPIENLDDAEHAIRTLAVRGAPAIGITAAYALAVAMAAEPSSENARPFLERLDRHAERLCDARPTAVNLRWAAERIRRRARAEPTVEALVDEAESIHRQDREICQAIGRHGASLIRPGSTVLTHCNAGALAVSALGTATAPMYLRHEEGVPFRVLVDETRPLLQGARLTAWELNAAGIQVELICDSMAATFMAAGDVDLVLVGTDRVTRNGDVVNKIGTLGLAVLCRHFSVPFYVACPSTTYDPHTESGAQVTIEERDPGEVLGEAAARVPARNPAFDVTPAAMVSGIVTEHGIALPPLSASLARMMRANDADGGPGDPPRPADAAFSRG